MRIAASIDYRGENDDRLFFLFREPPSSLLKEAFDFLVCDGRGIAKKAVVTEEHDVVRRNGKGYWRKAVEMVEPNFFFCGLEDVKVLIESALRRLHPCSLQWMDIDKFLNV